MAKITISNLSPTGSDLLFDAESYLHELGDAEVNATQGGCTPAYIIIAAILLWPRNAY